MRVDILFFFAIMGLPVKKKRSARVSKRSEYMLINGTFDGLKSHISAKGNLFADIFVRGLDGEGNADVEQLKFRTFNEDVVKKCARFKQGDGVILDLTIKEALVENVIE